MRNPGRDLPRAMVVTITLVTLVYLLPLFVATSMDAANVASWTDGIYIGYIDIDMYRYVDIDIDIDR